MSDNSRTMMYVYCCKFNNTNAVKIGWSTDPLKRCLSLGFYDKLCWFKVNANKSKIMCYESMIHNALSEHKFNGELPDNLHDGRTEYFEANCFEKFQDICGMLRLNLTVYKD